jgi:hypothetical protein
LAEIVGNDDAMPSPFPPVVAEVSGAPKWMLGSLLALRQSDLLRLRITCTLGLTTSLAGRARSYYAPIRRGNLSQLRFFARSRRLLETALSRG